MNIRKRLIWFAAAATIFTLSCRPSTQPHSPPRPSRPVVDSSGRQELSGRVVAISDGDTITILDSSDTQNRIRLAGVDAPESHQAFGEQSRLSLSEMILGKDVSVSFQKVDQYGRLVGKIILDGKDINLEQLKSGMA